MSAPFKPQKAVLSQWNAPRVPHAATTAAKERQQEGEAETSSLDGLEAF